MRSRSRRGAANATRREAATAGATPAWGRTPFSRQGRRRHDHRRGHAASSWRARPSGRHRRRISSPSREVARSSASGRASRYSMRSRTGTASTRTSQGARRQAQVGLDILAGSEQFDRPNAQEPARSRSPARPDARLRLRRHRRGQVIKRARGGVVCGGHDLPGDNPDVPSIRNAQRRSTASASSAPAANGSRSCSSFVGSEPGRAEDRLRPRSATASITRSGRLPDGLDRNQLGRPDGDDEPLGDRGAVRQLYASPDGRGRRGQG